MKRSSVPGESSLDTEPGGLGGWGFEGGLGSEGRWR